MRIKTKHLNMEFKIMGLSEKECNQLQYVFIFVLPKLFVLPILKTFFFLIFVLFLSHSFPLKVKNSDVTHEEQTRDITVYKYFKETYPGYITELNESAYLPCLLVGKPKNPSYLPIEVCEFLMRNNLIIILISKNITI